MAAFQPDRRARAVSGWPAIDIPPLARELLLSKDNYQQLHTTDHCVYGVFSDLVRAIDTATEETGFLRFAMTERLLVSGRHQALCAVDATRRVLEGGHRVETVAALLEKIIDEVADTMDRMADKIGTEIDDIEEQILAGEARSDMRSELGRLRRTCVRLHRQLAGLRVLFHRLEQKNTDNLNPALRLQAGKLAQRLDGLDHDVVEMRERSRLLEEELHFKMEEESNRHLHTLSVRDDAAAAADAGHRHLRHEHQGPAADRRRNRISVGGGDDDRRVRCGLSDHAASGHRQIELASSGIPHV